MSRESPPPPFLRCVRLLENRYAHNLIKHINVKKWDLVKRVLKSARMSGGDTQWRREKGRLERCFPKK